ncbi:MAG: RNA-binding S4 domain-containing protein [Synergistaceae bacterium]|nr:RNA-binding S4 domain-containing protein [Synergistaceae bacterium]
MRLDKFLKLSKLVKRRTVAQEMAEIGAVRINKRDSKPSSSVSVGDLIEIAYPRRIVTVRVLTSDETAIKRNAVAYEFVEEKKADQDGRPW